MSIRQLPAERAHAMLTVIKEFQCLSLENIETIAAACQWHRYESGNEIVRYHDHTSSVFFIVQGEIRVLYRAVSGQEVILCDLPAGEIFGELTAIDGHSRSATVTAKSSVLLASMPAIDFKNLIYSDQRLIEAILKRLTGQVRRLTERVYNYSTLTVRNRIQAELLRLAKNHITSPNTALISPAPTQTEIANLSGTYREAVSRELNHLVKNKLMLREGQDLHVLDISRLAEIVNDARGGF